MTASPNAADSVQLAREYLALLARGSNEQFYQRFIEEHTELVPRDFVLNHGVGETHVGKKCSMQGCPRALSS